jgi:adenine-specific DNA-methyltransferase
VQKAIYASDWKDGQPIEDAAGSSHIFKYQRLENYEDTLNNITFEDDLRPQPELLSAFPDYMLRYMLSHETRASGPRLNVDKLAHPFDYKLYIARYGETREETVDLVETFNYLLGVRVTRRLAFTHQERPYRVVLGAVGLDSVAIIWRDTQGLDLEQDKDFIAGVILADAKPDRVYVNGDCYVPGASSLDPIFKERMAG